MQRNSFKIKNASYLWKETIILNTGLVFQNKDKPGNQSQIFIKYRQKFSTTC